MKYNININQKAIIDNGFDLDLIDCAILNYIQDFAKSNKIIKIIYDGQEYFWIQYKHFIKEMPLLGIKNKQALKRRVDKIVECGILEKHLLNGNSTYFKFGDNYDKLISYEGLGDDEGVVGKVEGGEYDNTRGGSMKSGSIKHNTNNNNTNNNIYKKKDIFQKAKALKDEFLKDKDEDFKEVFEEFLEIRKKKGASNSNTGMKMLINKIENLSKVEKKQKQLIETAIEKGRKTVFNPIDFRKEQEKKMNTAKKNVHQNEKYKNTGASSLGKALVGKMRIDEDDLPPF